MEKHHNEKVFPCDDNHSYV